MLLGWLAAAWAGAPPPVTFTDVTDEVGLAGITNLNDFTTSQHGGGLAVLDFDHDGWWDLYFVRKRPPNVLLRNEGGVFTDVTAGSGAEDLVLHGVPGNRVLLGDGQGHFRRLDDVGIDGPDWYAMGGALGDFDHDGRLDLYVANHASDMTPFLTEPPDATSFDDSTCLGNALYLQVAPLDWVERGVEAGVDSGGCTLGVAAVDLDEDGWLDLYSTNDHGAWAGEDALYWGAGLEGGLPVFDRDPEVRPAINGMGFVTADYDRSGTLDFYLSNTAPNLLFENIGPRLYVDAALQAGVGGPDEQKVSWSAGFEDFDLDGWPDLYVVNANTWDLFFHNRGDGTFADLTQQVLPPRGDDEAVPFGGVFFDFDNDGDLDVVKGGLAVREEDGWKEAVKVLRNDRASDHHWLQLHLRATGSHPDAIGARVTVRAGEDELHQQVVGGTGFASARWPILTFGLAEHDVADEVEIAWPSGRVERLLGVGADQRLLVVEGAPSDLGAVASSEGPTEPPVGCATATGATGWLWALLLAAGRRRR